mmetsp:Transcript_23498/g.57724  ORF Transcript_23498/g.57724 Transcript_23498/m.57724 type:complete len:110 (+) Transcript_23498:48-377(+)
MWMRISLLLAMPLMAVAFVSHQDSSFSDLSSSEVYFADEIFAAANSANKKHHDYAHHSLPHFLQLAPKPPSHPPPMHVLHQAFSEAVTLPELSWYDEDDGFHSWAWDEI